ncbi:Dyp-type peroxidase domain-containing protein, partial [Streptococcus suis]
ITFGFGPSLFDDRFGLAAQRPAGLERLPAFLGDDLDPERSDGDLCIQACADDPQVAVHAIRNLSRIAFGRASIRWSQLGFGRTSKTTADQSTP